MSRCFPYLRLRNDVPGDALIESIKLQNGRENSKMERSKERKERKEKRNEKKRNEQKGLPCKVGDAKICMPIDTKSLCGEKYNEDPYLLKGKEVEAEQLEKSDLTEEHEHPINSQTASYLSDSARSSKKRKRHNSPSTSPASCSRTHGNILRIRLQSQKQREPDALLIQDQQCSSSGRVNCVAQQNVPNEEFPFNNVKTDTDIKKVSPKPVEEIHHSTAGKDKKIAQAEGASRTKPHKDERRWAKLCGKMDVFVPLTQVEQNDCDDQWLFETKPTGSHISQTKRLRADDDGLLCNTSATMSMWPSAHYLPVADIHALPYTIPF